MIAQQEDSLAKRYFEEEKMERDSIMQTIVGRAFAPFSATSLFGGKFSEQQLKDKITIVNFWFKACAPCIMEMPALNDIYDHFQSNPNFQFISFTFDPNEVAQSVARREKILFSIFPISRVECYRLNFDSGFPTTMIVNKEGGIVFYKMGGIRNSTQLEEIKEELHKLLTP
jgi:thiol-disulfide isomerase/thioredoxin